MVTYRYKPDSVQKYEISLSDVSPAVSFFGDSKIEIYSNSSRHYYWYEFIIGGALKKFGQNISVTVTFQAVS